MKANSKFINKDKKFWAYIKLIGNLCGYTKRKTATEGAKIKVPTVNEILKKFNEKGIDPSELIYNGNFTKYGKIINDYIRYRADILNTTVKNNLMNQIEAKKLFNTLKKQYNPKYPFPMNKQKGDKKDVNYFTSIINMLIEDTLKKNGLNNDNVDYDPQSLTTIFKEGFPIRTFSRRYDGAFPSVFNPISIWEIKEYYYTTTFGSRISDGIYETLLDGLELEEIRNNEDIKINHYLFTDAYDCWWELGGKSYLCRMIDMIHMGYVKEVIFGKEVIEKVPKLVDEWINKLNLAHINYSNKSIRR